MTSLSEALKSNTTLTKLRIGGKRKRNNTQLGLVNNQLFFPAVFMIVEKIGETGAASLSDALKSNTTLVELSLLVSQKHKMHP